MSKSLKKAIDTACDSWLEPLRYQSMYRKADGDIWRSADVGDLVRREYRLLFKTGRLGKGYFLVPVLGVIHTEIEQVLLKVIPRDRMEGHVTVDTHFADLVEGWERVAIADVESVDSVLAKLHQEYETYAAPWYASYASLEQIHEAVNSNPSIYCPVLVGAEARGIVGVATAALMGDPGLKELVAKYRAELKKHSSTPNPRFESVVQYVTANSLKATS